MMDKNEKNDSNKTNVGIAKPTKTKGYIGKLFTSKSELVKQLDPRREAIRQDLVRQFGTKKLRKRLTKDLCEINSSREISSIMKLLFDETGQPSHNMPLEEIIEQRKQLDSQIAWLEVITAELRNKLDFIKEAEQSALDLVYEAEMSNEDL